MTYYAEAINHFQLNYKHFKNQNERKSKIAITKTREIQKEDADKLRRRAEEQSTFINTFESDSIKAFTSLVTYYHQICYTLCSTESMQSRETWKLLDDISLLIRVYPQTLASFIKIFESDEEFDILASDQELVNNTKSIENAFGYNPILGKTLDGKFRYLVNMPHTTVVHYLDKTKELTQDEKANARIFMEMSHQSRWGNIWLQIISALLWIDTVTEADAWRTMNLPGRTKPRKAIDLITIKAIVSIVKRFDILPFYVRSDGRLQLERGNSVKWGTSMVPLLYSLLELSKEEKGCNITPEAARIMVRYRFIAARTSLENVMLDEKGIYTKVLKLITLRCQNTIKITRDRDYSNARVYDGPMVETEAYRGEKNDLEKLCKEKMYPDWYAYVFSFMAKCNQGDKIANTERVRFLMVMNQIFGNPGIYYKTSLVLEAVKSIEAQIKNILNLPKPQSFITVEGMDIPLEYDWGSGDEIWDLIAKKYLQRVKEVSYVLERKDFEEWYVSLLTNRSQGMKVELGDMVDGDKTSEKGKLLVSVAQARIAAFLLDLPTYYTFIKFLQALKNSGMCTTRFQNNRRARIVEIVPNVDQTAYSIVLRVFNETKKLYDDVAVGKQEGGIYDMALQLMVSGNPYAISIYSDVSAMDASTQPFVAAMFPQLLSEFIQKRNLGPLKYFSFKQSEYDVKISNVQQPQKTVISALTQNLATVLSQRLAKKYILRDSIFGTKIEINPGIFESGRFDTSAQHTTLLSCIARVVIDRLRNEEGGLQADFILRKFGDDSYDAMMMPGFLGSDRLLEKYVNYTTEYLHRTGFEVETEVSRMMGDFLQQLAYNGVQVPKSARSSVYCDERGNTAVRDPVAQIKVVADVFSAASQRTYAPENVQSIVRSAWEVIRTIRLVTTKEIVLGTRWRPYKKSIGQRSYFQFPSLLISVPPLNFPNLNFQIDEIIFPYTSLLRCVGDSKFVWIMNHLFTNQDKVELLALSSKDNQRYAIHPYDLFKLRMKDPLLIDSIVMASFNRASILSKKRTELLTDEIDQMASTMLQFYNQELVFKSVTAWKKLREEYGESVPEHIAYWSQPISKIKDMFSAITESVLDVVEINDDFMKYLSKFEKHDPKEIIDKFLTSCFIIESDKYYDPKPIEAMPIPIIPGYRELSDYYYYTIMAGSPLLDKGKVTKAARIFESKYGQNFDLETALRIGVKLFSKGPKAFELYMETLSLPIEIRLDFQQAVASGALAISDLAYHTGFQRDIQFAISGNVERLLKYFNTPPTASNNLRRTMNIVLRDYLMLTVNMNANKSLSIKPAALTEAFYERRRLLRRLGIDTVEVA